MMELRTENLVVGYDKAPLIKDVNLKVVSGQVLTLIGPNGAGKSTILKTITRQLKRIGGTIYLGQESMNNMRDSDVSKSLSMVMTERLQTELLTGRDVVASGRYPYTGRFGILSKEDWEKVDEAIALVHAQYVQDQDFRKMSDGQRQRLMLARAICQDTDILLLDEPTKAIDGIYKESLGRLMMDLKNRGKTIVMVSHDLDFCGQYADRCGLFAQGNLIGVNNVRKFFTKNKFYTTSVNKMAGRSIENAVNKEDVVCFLKAENII